MNNKDREFIKGHVMGMVSEMLENIEWPATLKEMIKEFAGGKALPKGEVIAEVGMESGPIVAMACAKKLGTFSVNKICSTSYPAASITRGAMASNILAHLVWWIARERAGFWKYESVGISDGKLVAYADEEEEV